MFDRYPPKSVVVGIDGSQAAIRAARWAVDEVAGTDIPLRLLHVAGTNPNVGPREALGAAEEVLHDACRAVDEMGKPLKVETEIIHGIPLPELVAASQSTTLICVGDKGCTQHPKSWLGSTARELAGSGHCSVAIVRGDAAHETGAGCIVARVDESPDDLDVLDLAVNEALRRHAPLRVVTTARSGSLDVLLKRPAGDYPEVAIETIELEGSFLDYVAKHAASIQLIMLSSARTGEMRQLLGADGELALTGTNCSLLIVGLERLGCS